MKDIDKAKKKYQLWFFPKDWPADTTPHWTLSWSSDDIAEVFIERIALEREYPDCETMITTKVYPEIVV